MKSWARELFGPMHRAIAAEDAADPEPRPRFSPAWTAWLYRDLCRVRCRAELAEAYALTTDPSDPAPIASLGLVAFLEWSKRQDLRRRARRRTAA